jgi:SAM-dependent methyltransferase
MRDLPSAGTAGSWQGAVASVLVARRRPRLPVMARDAQVDAVIRSFYRSHYSSLIATADGSLFERYLHASMERRYHPETHYSRVLEVGGNRGEHVPYVRHGFDEYLLTDLFLPQPEQSLLADRRLRLGACDVAQLPYANGSFDRVISTCLLHHVASPLRAVEEMRRVTRQGGVVTILVPTDPGLAYRTGKALTSGHRAKKAGVVQEFRLVSALDHCNHFRSIRTQIVHALAPGRVTVDWKPFRVPSVEINAFAVFHSVV